MDIRLGIVGLGWGARVARALHGCSHVRLIACHARNAAAREAFAAEQGIRACDSYEKLINDDSLNGIVIMTPNGTHRDLAIAAMRAGRHVLVTKPIATTLGDAAEMIRVADETRRILAIGHQSRRHPALRALERLLKAGDLGALRMIEGNTSSPTGLTLSASDWRAQAAECPGGPLIQLGIHYVDNFQHLFGTVDSVSAWLGKVGGGVVEPDTATLLLGFSSGATGYLGSSYVTPYTRWIRVTGEKAAALFQSDGSLTLQPGDGSGFRTLVPVEADRDGVLRKMLTEEVIEFAECIHAGAKPEISAQRAARNLAVVLAAVESHRRRTPVAVDELMQSAGLRP